MKPALLLPVRFSAGLEVRQLLRIHMMTPLAQKKLQIYEQRIGAMNSAEALQLAIEAEEYAKACGPFDQAYSYFTQQQLTFENYAALLEQRETMTSNA